MLRPAIVLFLILSLITGIAYPVLITSIGKIFFAEKSAGSFITHENVLIGSALIGQSFSQEKYFWDRPSSTISGAYNPLGSEGTNLGPTNPVLLLRIINRSDELRMGSNLGPVNPNLIENIKNLSEKLRQSHPQQSNLIPVDLVTSSGSGLDPHITPAAAFYQAQRIANARKISVDKINTLINDHIEDRQLWLLGEQRVNVLQLNLALDIMFAFPNASG